MKLIKKRNKVILDQISVLNRQNDIEPHLKVDEKNTPIEKYVYELMDFLINRHNTEIT